MNTPDTSLTTEQTLQVCRHLQNSNLSLPLPPACAPYSRECNIAKTQRRMKTSAVGLGTGAAAAVATHVGTRSVGLTVVAFLLGSALGHVVYRAATPYGEYPAACDPEQQRKLKQR